MAEEKTQADKIVSVRKTDIQVVYCQNTKGNPKEHGLMHFDESTYMYSCKKCGHAISF